MILNGKEIRVLSGAITIYGNIPLSLTKKRNLSEEEADILDRLFYDILNQAEVEYNGSLSIDKQLAITIDIEFNNIEIELLKEALNTCIQESMARKNDSINNYINGDQYNLELKDFIKLAERFNSIR